MIFYFSLLAVSVLLVAIPEGLHDDRRLFFMNRSITKKQALLFGLVASCILLVVVGSVRSLTTGNDVLQYQKYFYKGYFQNGKLVKMEPGYVLLSEITRFLTGNYRVFLVVVQILAVVPVYYVIARSSKIKWLSVFLFQTLILYVNSFNILRQTIAMSFMLLALHVLLSSELDRKNSFLYCFLVAMAASFHIVSIIFLPLILLKKHVLTIPKLAIIVVLSLIIFYFRVDLLNVLMRVFDRGYYGEETLKFNMGTSTVFLIMLTLIAVIYDLKKGLYTYRDERLALNIIVYALLFNVVWAWFPNHARITQFIFLFAIILIPNLIAHSSGKLRIGKLIFITAMMLVFYGYQLKVTDYPGIMPYELMRHNPQFETNKEVIL